MEKSNSDDETVDELFYLSGSSKIPSRLNFDVILSKQNEFDQVLGKVSQDVDGFKVDTNVLVLANENIYPSTLI